MTTSLHLTCVGVRSDIHPLCVVFERITGSMVQFTRDVRDRTPLHTRLFEWLWRSRLSYPPSR